MHPLLANRKRLIIYGLAWIPLVAIQTIQMMLFQWPFVDAVAFALPGPVLAATLFLTSGYLCRTMPIQTTRPWVMGCSLGLASILMGSFWAWLTHQTLRLLCLFPALEHMNRWIPKGAGFFMGLVGSGTLLYLLTVAMNYILMAQDQTRESERTEQSLRVMARDAELKALRAQLNPHFLFNSLNSISALTTIDPKRARQMCVLLSDFLRKSLRLGERPMVKLSEELELVKAYLSIEQIRFGSRLNVEWDIEPEAQDAVIPTLLLQPLVENAIKHGIAAIPEGGTIRIAAAYKGGFTEIRVENPSDPEAERPQGLGMGLRQVKSRLQGRFGGEIFFDAVMKNDRYIVLLAFPSEVNP